MKSKQVRSSVWRIVIPNLQNYRDASPQQLQDLKLLILQRLKHRPQDKRSSMKSEFERGLHYYRIALQHHANGIPHLDILLVYQKSLLRQVTDFNFLLKKPAHVTTYRKLNAAILDYGKKQDLQSLTNIPDNASNVIELQSFKNDPYRYLELKMHEDPLNFSVEQYVQKHDLAQYISAWSSIKTKLKDMQVAAANLKLKQKSGFKLITPTLIKQKLNNAQQQRYFSWEGYRIITSHLNQMITQKGNRPFKTKQLLLVGRPDIGKTSLIRQIEKYCAVYHMDISNWFPKYRDQVYSVIAWNQFKLKGGMSHTDLLKLLEGYPMDLQYKGGSSLRRDNQLIIMTSNMTLDHHISLKFKDHEQRQLARANLNARITQVKIPSTLDLFVLFKLLS